jgi:predicted RNA-binding protein YlqC (UPF0109 family)
MSKRISKTTDSVEELGDIQVKEWDFMSLMNRDIKELEIGRALRKLGNIQVTEWDFKGFINKEIEIARPLRRLGNIRVMEWDFKTAMPKVSQIAYQEVDVVDLIKRAANYKVIDWDFKSTEPEKQEPAPQKTKKRTKKSGSRKKINPVVTRLKNFLQYVTVNLIDQPNHAQIKIQEIAPEVIRFKLVLVKKDVAMLIGTEGHTAAAIRSILKATAEIHGLHALLEIVSHEEEATAMDKQAKESHGRTTQTSNPKRTIDDSPLAPIAKKQKKLDVKS